MPLTTKKLGKKWRVVEVNTGDIANNAGGTALDGGGHESKTGAQSQAAAVNISKARKKGANIPSKRNMLA